MSAITPIAFGKAARGRAPWQSNAHPRACPLLWSLSGDKRTLNDHRKSVAFDPLRYFTTIKYCIAKGSFAFDVGISRELRCWLGRTMAGPCHSRFADA